MTAQVFCNICGHRNPLGSNFCSSCGSVLDQTDHEHSTITFHPERPADVPDDDVKVEIDEIPSEAALLVVKRGAGAGSKFSLDDEVTTAGRHPESGIFLDDITVSRRHADFLRTGRGYMVKDVGSLNGTYVNRERIDEAWLANGDEVQIGKFKLVFFLGAEA